MNQATPRPISGDERELFFYYELAMLRVEDSMLHEPLWELNTKYPTAPPRDREELAEATLLANLEQGLINVRRSGQQQALNCVEARSVILGNSWRTLPVGELFEPIITPASGTARSHRSRRSCRRALSGC